MYSNLSMFTYCTEALSHSNNPLIIEITLRPTKCLLHNREKTLGCGKQTHSAKDGMGRGLRELDLCCINLPLQFSVFGNI